MVIVIASASHGASAQTMYRCASGSSTYLSDRPCTTGAGSKLGSYGPEAGRRDLPAPSYSPPVGKAPEHLAYLSPACASLNDAIRTGPSRGLQSSAMADLHNEYRSKCDEDDQSARQRLYQEKSAQRSERREQQRAEQVAHERQLASRDQCAELLRILLAKRKQLDAMSTGEKADFYRSEANYNSRCKAS